MKCSTCKFWLSMGQGPIDSESPGFGECHRLAPTVLQSAQLDSAMSDEASMPGWRLRCAAWPVTHGLTFCGEFAPLKERVGFC